MNELYKLIAELEADGRSGEVQPHWFDRSLAALKAFRDWHTGEWGDVTLMEAVSQAILEASQ